jgi:hypothetical protein
MDPLDPLDAQQVVIDEYERRLREQLLGEQQLAAQQRASVETKRFLPMVAQAGHEGLASRDMCSAAG